MSLCWLAVYFAMAFGLVSLRTNSSDCAALFGVSSPIHVGHRLKGLVCLFLPGQDFQPSKSSWGLTAACIVLRAPPASAQRASVPTAVAAGISSVLLVAFSVSIFVLRLPLLGCPSFSFLMLLLSVLAPQV